MRLVPEQVLSWEQRPLQKQLGSWEPSTSKLAFSFDPKLEPFKSFHIWPNRAFQFLIFLLFLYKDADLKGPLGTSKFLGNHPAAFPVIESETD